MANSFVLASNYTDLLDEVFKKESVTAKLSGDPRFIREGADAKTIYYPQMTTGGLGDYSREKGYPDGGVSLIWKNAEFNYDRGMMKTITSSSALSISTAANGSIK